MKKIIFGLAILGMFGLSFPARVLCQSAATAPSGDTAQESDATTVAGIVLTTQGIPVPGAMVRVIHVASGRSWVTWTDEDGRFSFPSLPAGHYRLQSKQLGFAVSQAEADFAGTSSTPARLTLHVNVPPEPRGDSDRQAKSAGQPANASSSAPENAPGARTSEESSSANQKGATEKTSRENAAQVPNSVPKKNQQQVAASKNHSKKIQRKRAEQTDATLTAAIPSGANTPDTINVPVNSAPVDESDSGQESSTDAFLMTGTIGASSTSGMPGGAGTAGGQDAGVGADQQDQPANASGTQKDSSSKTGKGRHISKKAQASQDGGLGEGVDALWARNIINRKSANRVRFGGYSRYDNSVWNARPYNLAGPPQPKLGAYEEKYGVNLGGPFSLPHLYNGQDRTFFFASYEGERAMSSVDQVNTVPTAAERGGDFTGTGLQLFDPASNFAGPRAPLGERIPQDRLDKSALGLLQFIPLPNLPGTVNNFSLHSTIPIDGDWMNVKILHTISPKLNLQGSYYFYSQRQSAINTYPVFTSTTGIRGQSLNLGLTQNLTHKFIHDTRINWNRLRNEQLGAFAFKQNVAAEVGINGVSQAPIDFGVPNILFAGFGSLFDQNPALTRNQTFRFIDSVSYTMSRHTLHAGFELRRIQRNSITDPFPRGEFDFTGLLTSQLDSHGSPIRRTGSDFADFLLGLPTNTSVRFGSSNVYFRSWGYIGYVQDDWRIHPRFTLAYGVRYEAVTPPIELFNNISNLDVNSGISAVATVLPGGIGPFHGRFTRGLVNGDYNNWAPRVGMAWRPFAALPVVVRSGYSIFYNEAVYDAISAALFDQPPIATSENLFTSASQVLTLENGFPHPTGNARNTYAVDPNYRVGYAQVWNLDIETRLPKNWLFDVVYTGTKGTHLDMLRAPNRFPIGSVLTAQESQNVADASGFLFDVSGASSTYHALQARLQRLLAHGIRFQALYTYGKSIDNASAFNGVGALVVQNDQNFNAERGLSSFDMRNQFSAIYSYELPFGERRRWLHSGWGSAIFGDLQVSGVTTINSGQPFTALVNGILPQPGGTNVENKGRPDQVGNASLPASQRTAQRWFNPNAFALPGPGLFGDAARSSIPGPAHYAFDVALTRRFRFGDDRQYAVDFRWEGHNIFNTPFFDHLRTVENGGDFGGVRSALAMRTLDFKIRVHF